MKALIKKEIRLLMPAWITAMLLATVPGILNVISIYCYGFMPSGGGLFFFVQLMFAAGVLLLGINSFGEELSYNTFSALLSQPLKRPRIWLIKTATLAIAFISVWLAGILLATWQLHFLKWWFRTDFNDTFEFLTLSALVAFSGGLWTTLLLRQITGAFWFTLLTPVAIIFGISAMFQDWIAEGKSFNTFVVAALVLYSVAGFFLAWRLFMRAQDIQWTGGEISLPRRERVSKMRAGLISIRPRHRFSALAWKELQLHQGTLLIAAIILVLHLTALFFRDFHPRIQNPNFEFALKAIWILWLLMPMLIGAAAIAEERRMGTLDLQLCLPVTRGTQLLLKFCVALVLSLVFGALMPVSIEGTKTLDYWHWIIVGAFVTFFVSFYASSLARTTLQGIGFAILMALVVYLYEVQTGIAFRGPLVAQFSISLIVLGWLTFSNFRHARQDWKFWIRNITATGAVFICAPVLANAIYFLWEFARWRVF
jgi:ABC-type transport system involved in multi-copper enzyme maturation permease subunit